MSKMNVDILSLQASFPKSMPVPPRLLEFGRWLKAIDHGTLGYFDVLAGEPLDDSFVGDPERTAILARKLGIFLFLPDGSRLAMWDHGGTESAVVLIGSEGELENLAPNLDEFLVGLSQGKTGVNDLDDEDASASRDTLKKWLAQQGVTKAKAKMKVPDFQAWFAGEVDPAATTTPEAPRGEFPMHDFLSTLLPLLGKTSADGDVRRFLEALGHWPLPRFKSDESSLYVEDKERGFCLLFEEAEREAGSKARVPVLDSCFFYSEGEEEYQGFCHPMPRGIAWTDTAASLVARLGPPNVEIKNKKTGALSSHRWAGLSGETYGEGQPYVSVSYKGGGSSIKLVFLGIL